MLFHPLTLKLLADFKYSAKHIPDLDLLALILDNTENAVFDLVHDILYSYKIRENAENTPSYTLVPLKERIVELFYKCVHPVTNKYTCFLKEEQLSYLSEFTTKLILENRKSLPLRLSDELSSTLILELEEQSSNFIEDAVNREIVGESRIIIPTLKKAFPNATIASRGIICSDRDTNMEVSDSICNSVDLLDRSFTNNFSDFNCSVSSNVKRFSIKRTIASQNNTLNFVKRYITKKSYKKFEPVIFPSGIYVFDKNNIDYVTKRKRGDLTRERKLQFIKRWDQKRPVVYQLSQVKYIKHISRRIDEEFRLKICGDGVNSDCNVGVYSFHRLPDVIDYDYSSSEDWDEGTFELEPSVDESDESATSGSLNDMIESDSEDKESDGVIDETIICNSKISKATPSFLLNSVKVETYCDEFAFKNNKLK